MDSDTKQFGHWEQLKILGSGGFGQVSLWCDPSTGQMIAIKKPLEVALKDESVKGKLIERWCNEVEIMKKLNHMNIVATLETPSNFDIAGPLPVLAMEYCSNGNLRQVLNKAENCCGLHEPEILNILMDISSGLAYLHSCKIIHRDIKPDNVVLQENDSKIIYKLIDLGYAKALDQSSLSKSFVGTIQYIAPELFMGKAYTSSVDYWSFGLMAHEIITGYRPFLPDRSPSEWMKHVQNKSRNIICVVESSRGDIVFYEKISRKNHSSRCFLEGIEKWLQLALDWDGQTRGRETEKNRLVIFENLSEIISKKLINVFSLPTYEILSYEVTSETDISDLKHWLKVNTLVEESNQLLLLPSGKCMNAKGNFLRNLESEKLDRSVVGLFLFDNAGPISIKKNEISAPISLDEFRNFPNRTWPYRQLKRFYTDSVYFLQSQATLYRYFLQGIKTKIANTKKKTLAIESLYEDLVVEWNKIENYGHFLSLSHKIDLENYIYYRKAGKLKCSSFVQKWIQNAIDVNNKITELRSSFNRTKQRQLLLMAKERCRNLHTDSNNDHNQWTSMDSLVNKGQHFWEDLQKLCKSECEIPVAHNGKVVELVNRAIDETNQFLNSQMLRTLFEKIWEADESLSKFISQLTDIYRSMNMLKCLIENTQIERQKEVWSLVEIARGDFNEQADSIESSASEVRNLVSTGTVGCVQPESLELKKREINETESDATLAFDSVKLSTFYNVDDTLSVIEDNNRLRYRVQEVQHKCNQVMKEIGTLKWDFV